MKLPAWTYADLVGKGFAEGGRGPLLYDCWGVLQTNLRRRGFSPTDYPTDPGLLAGALEAEWNAVTDPQPGDGVLLRSLLDRYVWHIGVIVRDGWMIHAREEVGVCIEAIEPAYCRRVVGYYRFRG